MFRNKKSEIMYMKAPDVLYTSADGTWYAAYHEELSILTNAGKTISVYTYRSKKDYREVRDIIIKKYRLRETKIRYSQY